VRLGILQFGTVQWVADVIARNHLDTAHGVAIETTKLANTDAGRIGLLAGGIDVAVLDWPFVAAQRAAGNKLCFAAFSDAVGGLIVPADSPVHALPDLAGRSLGIAGGPSDKSWLIVQAAGRHAGIDLAKAARPAYGAPPLLGAKLQQGELDAVLTYWNFAARLQAAGLKQVLSVADAARMLGLPGAPGLVGFAFREDWARANPAAIGGFLRAVAAAQDRLRTDNADWTAVRPLMDAPDDAAFAALRDRFIAGIVRRPAAEQEALAAKVLAILVETGGAQATGGVTALPPGVFWPDADGTG
jgi:NitT/TauT family transport system substrate-binding protein